VVRVLTDDLLRRLQERAEAYPDFVETLEFLADAPPADEIDGGTEPDPELLALARRINAGRAAEAEADFEAHSLTAEEVATRLGVASRQAVAQRRARGSLLGAPLRGRVRYPAWQFGTSGLHPDLPRLIALLTENGITGADEADDIMRMEHSSLGGRSLVEVWQAGDWDLLGAWLGDIGGWRT
jgi:hypothetical protein